MLARGPDAVDEETPDEELDVHFVRNYTREELDHNTKVVEEASKADKPHKEPRPSGSRNRDQHLPGVQQ